MEEIVTTSTATTGAVQEEETKTFFAFGGDDYYPKGGMEDCKGMFSTVLEAITCVIGEDWWHVYEFYKGRWNKSAEGNTW